MYVRACVCVRQAERRTHIRGALYARRGDLSWRILVDVRVESAVARRQVACRLSLFVSYQLACCLRLVTITASIRATTAAPTSFDESELQESLIRKSRARKKVVLFKTAFKECCLRGSFPLFPATPPLFSFPIAYIHRIQS